MSPGQCNEIAVIESTRSEASPEFLHRFRRAGKDPTGILTFRSGTTERDRDVRAAGGAHSNGTCQGDGVAPGEARLGLNGDEGVDGTGQAKVLAAARLEADRAVRSSSLGLDVKCKRVVELTTQTSTVTDGWHVIDQWKTFKAVETTTPFK
jgi:hypothetical protein